MGTPLNTAVRQLSFATSVAAALSITACSPRPQTESRVCADTTGRRISDDNCRRSGGGAGYYGGRWYYGGKEAAGSRIGDKVSGGSYSPRGGFGASARGSSGG
jgi:hypothetical protein